MNAGNQDCEDWFNELVTIQDVVLDDDLATLQKSSAEQRIADYNTLKSNESEFQRQFSRDCRDFLTSAERDQVRSRFRLARLLIAASFHAAGRMPRALEDDFIDAELQAVVDFDRYKRFDALSEDQIEEQIRRMEGEVYELVTEYTSTQIANIDDLVDNPNVQQDVLEQLLDRYERRREKIRQGFFTYVEAHGLEHMVQSIEDAIRATAGASEARKRVDEKIREGLESLSDVDSSELGVRQRELEASLWETEQELSSGSLRGGQLDATPETLSEEGRELSTQQKRLLDGLDSRIETLSDLEPALDEKIRELEAVREEARTADRDVAREEVTTILDDELSALRDEKDRLEAEVERLRNERDGIEAAHERLTEHQQELASRVERIEASVDVDERGLDGENVVTAPMARLYEMDYIGRFETSMAEVETVELPDRTFDVPVDYWAGRSEHRSARTRLAQFLGEGDDPETYPQNQAVRYSVTDSKFFGLSESTAMVIEAQVLNHLEAYAMNDFDARPADLDDLLSTVNQAIAEAERTDCSYLLGIASPTGWADRVVAKLRDEDATRSRFRQRVSVCLIDLQTGELIYDETDELVRANAGLFEPSIDAERVEACVDVIRTEYVDDLATDSVLLREVVDEHGFDDHVVKRAFNRLEAAGDGEQLYVGDYGLGLEVG